MSLAAWLPLIAVWTAAGQDPAAHRARTAELLADPRPHEAHWRATLFQSVSRLEHAPIEETWPAWLALANAHPAGRADLLLFLRRHGLPMPEADVDEGVDALLERALAAWGARRPEQAADALRRAALAAPADERVRDNLAWLERRPPPSLAPAADARAAAHAVLAARGALP